MNSRIQYDDMAFYCPLLLCVLHETRGNVRINSISLEHVALCDHVTTEQNLDLC